MFPITFWPAWFSQLSMLSASVLVTLLPEWDFYTMNHTGLLPYSGYLNMSFFSINSCWSPWKGAAPCHLHLLLLGSHLSFWFPCDPTELPEVVPRCTGCFLSSVPLLQLPSLLGSHTSSYFPPGKLLLSSQAQVQSSRPLRVPSSTPLLELAISYFF